MRRVSEHKRPQGKQVGLNIRLRGEDQVKVAGRLRGFRHILLFTMIWLSLSSFLISIAYGSPVKELGTARPTPSVTVTDGENVVDCSFSAAWERQSFYALGRYWVFFLVSYTLHYATSRDGFIWTVHDLEVSTGCGNYSV